MRRGHKKNRLEGSSLKRRMILIVLLGSLLSLALAAWISYRALLNLRNNKVSSTIQNYLSLVTSSIEQDYMYLLQLSQQMIPQGITGQLAEDYWATNDVYDRMSLAKMVPESINLITFSNLRCELVMYYNTGTAVYEFQNQPLKDSCDLNSLPTLIETSMATFQALHTSVSRVSNNPVLSITREASFPDRDMLIYAEIRVDSVQDSIRLEPGESLPYYFVQLNADGDPMYVDPAIEADFNGVTLDLNAKSDHGALPDYLWFAKRSQMGFVNLILIPKPFMDLEINLWIGQILLLSLISIGILVALILIFYRSIYRPLLYLGSEMSLVGSGSLQASRYKSRIEEFNNLFSEFNLMKQQLAALYEANREKDLQRHKLQVDMLYYQINPHFLMNSLNSARWMAVLHHEDQIDEYLSKLIYILGYSLGKVDYQTNLATEIKMLDTYVKLMQMRYDFSYELIVDETVPKDLPIARLLLQPIAENAIQHGLREDGQLRITIRMVDKHVIRIECYNEGVVLDTETIGVILGATEVPDHAEMRGIGLAYVKLLLEEFYGEAARLDIRSIETKGTVVTLHIPYEGDI